ncbi:hypothetical protein NQ318_000808 [Aromia moschata]|uniref:Uncharacterized protein n=1 Tax=Aromia moschata TaxID=1265417 RepID=A0AAV8X122_9CUCU|nr:hypothetical protein NQ318_000808 [Aromia moschata]
MQVPVGALDKLALGTSFSHQLAFTPSSLISQGSANQTRAIFTDADVLKVPDLNMAAESYKNIMSHLNSINGVTLLMANQQYIFKRKL